MSNASTLLDAPQTIAARPHAAPASRPHVAIPRVDPNQWSPPAGSGIRETLIAFGVAMLIALPILGWGGWSIYSTEAAEEAARVARQAQIESLDRLLAGPAGPMLQVDSAAHGRDVFLGSCTACHNADGMGIPKLGKDLVHSWFVASLDDASLVRFLETGRQVTDPLNTTKVPMPPKGGREDLTPDDLRAVVTYLRGLQDGRRMPPLPAPVVVVAPITEADKAAALAAAGGDAELAGYIASGTKLFAATCAACHGTDARGLPKNGKDLVTSAFIKSLNDDNLLAFIRKGRDPSDPANTTGVGMPAKGGNPALSDDDLLDVISYLRSLQGANTAK